MVEEIDGYPAEVGKPTNSTRLDARVTHRALPTTHSYPRHQEAGRLIAGCQNPVHVHSSAQVHIADETTAAYKGGFGILSQLILFRPFWNVLPRFESTSLPSE